MRACGRGGCPPDSSTARPRVHRLEAVAQHGELRLALRDRRAVGALAPLRHDVGDRRRTRGPARTSAARRSGPRRPCPRGSAGPSRCQKSVRLTFDHATMLPDASGCSSIVVPRALGCGRGGDPRLHDRPARTRRRRRGAAARTRRRAKSLPVCVERCRRVARAPSACSTVVGVEEAEERRLDEVEPGVAGRAEPARARVVHDAEPRIGRRGARRRSSAGRIRRGVVDEDRGPVAAASAAAASRAPRRRTARRRSPGTMTVTTGGGGGGHPPDCTAATDAATASATASSGSRERRCGNVKRTAVCATSGGDAHRERARARARRCRRRTPIRSRRRRRAARARAARPRRSCRRT